MADNDLLESCAIAWEVDEHRFELQVEGPLAALFLPDGQIIELKTVEWTTVAQAINMVMAPNKGRAAKPLKTAA